MLGFDFDVTGTETVRHTGQQFLEKLRAEHHTAVPQHGATPFEIASDLTGLALRYHPGGDVRFLEPCVGTGIFFSAFLHDAAERGDDLELYSAHGVEHDEHFAALAHDLWAPAGLTVHEVDFMRLTQDALPQATIVLSQPPATPHHQLSSEEKVRAGDAAEAATGIRPAGLADIYNHFVMATHQFLAPGAVSAWIIPTKFLTKTTGRAIRTYLGTQVRLRRIHRFDFAAIGARGHRDEIVDWSAVVFTNERPKPTDTFDFSSGGELFGANITTSVSYDQLTEDTDWAALLSPGQPAGKHPTLEDFFFIRRGWDIPGEKFFVQPETRAWAMGIQPFHMRPMLPAPKAVDGGVIAADQHGYPLNEPRHVVLSSHVDQSILADKDPALLAYFNTANDETRAAAKRPDSLLWYNLHLRRPAPILVQPATQEDTGAFRFIINESDGIAGPGWITMSPNLGFARPWFLNHDVDWRELIEVLITIPTPTPGKKPQFSPNAVASLDATAVAEYLAIFD